MTTKQCPDCRNTHLAQLRTLNLKYCPDCNEWIEWPLTEGQKPLLTPPLPVDTTVTKR